MGRMQEVPTLRELVQLDCVIALTCCDCKHGRFVPASALNQRHPTTTLHSVKTACKACGSRRVRIRPYQSLMPELWLENPVKT